MVGKWNNFEELEDSITMQELKAIIDANRKAETRRHKFMAALKGINLDDPNTESDEERFERIRRTSSAKLRGKSEEEYTLEEIGFGYETEGR
jgi:type I site-specific restriction-modification system R (restriction) subunit